MISFPIASRLLLMLFLCLVSAGQAMAAASQVAGGYAHTVVLKSDGSVWAWGANAAGQLGDGAQIERDSPVQVGPGFSLVTAGAGGQRADASHTIALKTDSSLWAWGADGAGQLGDNQPSPNQLAPAKVGTGFNSIASGAMHTVAIKADGTLWAWGSNQYGQLGNGNTTQQNSPVQIGSGYSAVAAGANHTLAIKTDGTLWAWGWNFFGQLGDGTIGDLTSVRSTPVQIGTGFTSVAANYGHSVAVKTDGSLWAWGNNGTGQLGDGSKIQRTTPVQIGTGFASVAAGNMHTVAIKTDGSLWAWGYNGNGQLGDGTTTMQLSPERIGASYSAVTAGAYHTAAIKTDGSLWGWGSNDTGQVGDGTKVQRNSPVQIIGSGPSAPGAPTIGAATPGSGQASINFTAPSGNGGSAITGYLVTCTASGQVARANTGTSSPITVQNLTVGVLYGCTVAASNIIGTGLSSTTVTVTPLPFTPGAPTIASAPAGNGQATIIFTAPTFSGASAITGYTASCSATGQTTSTKTWGSSPITLPNLTAAVLYSCSVVANNSAGAGPSSAALTVTPLPSVSSVRNALIMHASNSGNKTSVVRLINRNAQSAALAATAYDEAGNIVGVTGADLGTLLTGQMATFTSAQLEAAIAYAPSSPTAKNRIVFNANLPSFDLVNFSKDSASGNLSLSQAQSGTPPTGAASTAVRDALFVNASTSANKTSVLRLINLTAQSGAITVTAFNEAGSIVGAANTALGKLAAQQMQTFTSAQLEAAIGYTPSAPNAKYGVVFTVALPSFEIINFIKDVASGNLTLGQAQTYDRSANTGNSSTRNALVVQSSLNTAATSVVRLVNLYNQSGAITATAYNEAGSVVGTPNFPIGTLAPQQMATFTSAQLESAIGYFPTSASAKYHIAFTVNLPGFELIHFIKHATSGNLALGQMQIDDRSASSATSSTRNALFVNPSTSSNKTSVVRLINLSNLTGAMTATAYDESGNAVGTSNASVGTLAPQQIMSFTSGQLEIALGYTPSSPTAKYRLVFGANLPSFELINDVVDVVTGNVTLGQSQVD
jgi:alpha-tubulin suppressor-like RCC1 family protein